jgi:hypothetical protein
MEIALCSPATRLNFETLRSAHASNPEGYCGSRALAGDCRPRWGGRADAIHCAVVYGPTPRLIIAWLVTARTASRGRSKQNEMRRQASGRCGGLAFNRLATRIVLYTGCAAFEVAGALPIQDLAHDCLPLFKKKKDNQ